jgi:hypothetical protein
MSTSRPHFRRKRRYHPEASDAGYAEDMTRAAERWNDAFEQVDRELGTNPKSPTTHPVKPRDSGIGNVSEIYEQMQNL